MTAQSAAPLAHTQTPPCRLSSGRVSSRGPRSEIPPRGRRGPADRAAIARVTFLRPDLRRSDKDFMEEVKYLILDREGLPISPWLHDPLQLVIATKADLADEGQHPALRAREAL